MGRGIKNVLRSVLGLNTVIILKRVRERVKATNLKHIRLEMEKRWRNLDGIQST